MENVQNPETQAHHSSPPPPASPVIGLGDWLLTLIIMLIPLVNLIMLFVWGFGGGTNPSKANWAKASLILMLISLVLGILMFGAIVSLVTAFF
jgi:hypothetical protein